MASAAASPAVDAAASDAGLLVCNARIISGVSLDSKGGGVTGAIYTWMIVRSGRIESCGDGDSPTASTITHRFSERLDLGGRLVYPGLHDAHIHVAMTGKLLSQIDCSSCTIDGLTQRLKSFVATNPKPTAAIATAAPQPQVVCGFGWSQDDLGRYPTRHDLDAVMSDRPVLLMRACQHIGVANTALLKLAGLFRADVTDPEGGVIDREPASGLPSGIIRENAVQLFDSFTADSDDTRMAHIKLGLAQCLKLGLTAVQTNDGGTWQIYKALAQRNELPIRYDTTPHHTTPHRRTAPHRTASHRLTCLYWLMAYGMACGHPIIGFGGGGGVVCF